MNEFWQFLLGSTFLTTLLIFLGRFVINAIKDILVEKYKNKLEIETINFKGNLEKKIEKFRISYSKMFVEQAMICQEAYKKLIRAEKSLEYILRPVHFGPKRPDEEVAQEVIERANELFDFFYENEIVFTSQASETFELIKKNYMQAWSTYTRKEFLSVQGVSGELFVKVVNEMNEAYETTLKVDFQNLKKHLRIEFQKQLGIIEAEVQGLNIDNP